MPSVNPFSTPGVRSKPGQIELADVCNFARLDSLSEIGVEGEEYEDTELKRRGACAWLNANKYMCTLIFAICLIVLGVILYFLYPRTIQICYNLNFGKEVLYRLEGDEDEYEIAIKNSNYFLLDLQDLNIKAYYGEFVEDDQILSFDLGNWRIGAKTTSRRNVTYVYTQRFTAVVPSSRVLGCFTETVESLTFNLRVMFTGCILGLCRDVHNKELSYVKTCPSDDGWQCFNYKLL